MEKRMLGKTGMMVSVITYGGIISTDDRYDGAFPKGNGQDESDRYVEYAIGNGINYFDVAPKYGNAQERLGLSLMPYRNDIFLACKTLFRTADDAKRDLENSLKLLHTDYFDVYQLHALSTIEDVERVFSKGGAMETLLQAKKDGIIKNLGITCHYEESAIRALELYDFDTVLFPTNWGLHLKREFGEKLIQLKEAKNFGFLGMKSFIHRGWYNDDERYNSAFTKTWCKPIMNDNEWTIAAMKYALSMGIDTLVPPGNFEQFSFAIEHIEQCLENPLSEADLMLLNSKLDSTNGHDFL